MSDTDRILKAWRRQTMVWGAVVALLIATLAVQVERLLNPPTPVVAIVCHVNGTSVRCER
jgi:hypothetical protein